MAGIRLHITIVLRGLLYFFLLMAAAPWTAYPAAFRAVGNVVFSTVGSHRVARFDRFDDPKGMLDTRVSVGTDSRGPVEYLSSLGINSIREGYAPAAVIASLVLASPLTWAIRLRFLGAGLALSQVFVAARVAVLLLYGFSRAGVGDRRLLDWGDGGSRTLRFADQVLSGDLHSSYIFPALIWLVMAASTGTLSSQGRAARRAHR